MKIRCLALFALAAAFVTSCASTSGAGAMDEQAMMAKWGEYATPGEAHHVLDHKVGMWKLKVRMFNPDGSVAGESDATSECAWAMGGRFVVEVSLMPISLKVGTSGSSGWRRSLVSASTRSLPASMCGLSTASWSMMTCTSPATSAVSVGA